MLSMKAAHRCEIGWGHPYSGPRSRWFGECFCLGGAGRLLTSRRLRIPGVPDADRLVGTLRSALVESRENSPRHFRRVQRWIRSTVLEKGGGAFYSPDLKACVIDAPTVRLGEPKVVALIPGAVLGLFVGHQFVIWRPVSF